MRGLKVRRNSSTSEEYIGDKAGMRGLTVGTAEKKTSQNVCLSEMRVLCPVERTDGNMRYAASRAGVKSMVSLQS